MFCFTVFTEHIILPIRFVSHSTDQSAVAAIVFPHLSSNNNLPTTMHCIVLYLSVGKHFIIFLITAHYRYSSNTCKQQFNGFFFLTSTKCKEKVISKTIYSFLKLFSSSCKIKNDSIEVRHSLSANHIVLNQHIVLIYVIASVNCACVRACN